MTQFAAPADRYDRWMGRYSASLAPQLADVAGVRSGMRVLDVGCGPGSLTAELVPRVGADHVAAIDPAPQFAAACRDRFPDADVRLGEGENLPWDDAVFDVAAACLVIGFLSDPDRGVREMARVTRPGGVVAACMWDLASGGMTMLDLFWRAVLSVDPDATTESAMPGTAEGEIARRFEAAGLADVTDGALTAHVGYSGFDDFWTGFTYGIGPAGQYLVTQPAERQERIRYACRTEVPDGAFGLDARAWFARGVVVR